MTPLNTGKQIRNVGSVGGNIMTGSPISDLNPIFMASHCELTVASKAKGQRKVKFDHTFYTGYRKTVLAPDEILVDMIIPFTRPGEHFVAFKQARRRDDDIAIVNGAFFFGFDEGQGQDQDQTRIIKEARMSYGGLSYITKMALKAAKTIKGQLWSSDTFEAAMDVLREEVALPPEVPGSMVRYRQTLALSLLFKAFLTVSEKANLASIGKDEKSATEVFHKAPLKSSQMFEVLTKGQKGHDPLRRPLKHRSADKQVTGEAVYVDDIPTMNGELYIGFVLSTEPHAEIKNIDPSEAIKDEAVLGFFCYKDLDPKHNNFRMIIDTDEWLFADGEVHCVGQLIGVTVATSQEKAREAARKVKVSYKPLKANITMEDAIEAKSFHPLFGPRIQAAGNVEEVFEKVCDAVLESEVKSGSQDHFYMEPQCCLSVPSNEDGEMTLYAATQNPTEAQRVVAHCLNVPMNRVVSQYFLLDLP